MVLVELSERPSIQLLGDQTKQNRVRVAVLKASAGVWVWPGRVRDSQQVARSEHVPRLPVHRPVQRPRLRVVVEPAPHRQQLSDRDLLSVRHPRPKPRHRIIERKRTALGGLEDDGAGERLRDRPDPEVTYSILRECRRGIVETPKRDPQK